MIAVLSACGPGPLAIDRPCGSPSGGPAENPVARLYGPDAFPWTNQIRWSCVYNLNDFEGATDQDRFQAARAAAAANGGGVVYLPAGTYRFNEDLSLDNGIILRGETPNPMDARADTYRPRTRLEFPKYEPSQSGQGTANATAFKKILTQNPNRDSNLGLVNLDINRAGIEFMGDPDAGVNQNIVIWGVRSNNVAAPDPAVPDVRFQAPWLRYGDRFAANLRITAAANVLVAHNRLNDAITDSYEQPGYTVQTRDRNATRTYAEGQKVPFDYANHYGIVINRAKAGGFEYATDPAQEPGLFRPGIAIQDNWVYKTMRVGIHASGTGLIIRDNQILDRPDKQAWTDPTGTREPSGAVTLENRAIDWSGHQVLIEGNEYAVYRHQVMDGPYLSVDGEGILIQQCCGGTSVNGATIRKNQGNAYIGLYKVPEIRDVQISDNQLMTDPTGDTLIYVNADTNSAPGTMANVRIENNRLSGGILAQASLDGGGNVIRGNQGDDQGVLRASCTVAVRENTGFQPAPCLR
jgi:hypothetical protein